jgi:ABC-type sulfate/molybdate transport systems ATPase subunit
VSLRRTLTGLVGSLVTEREVPAVLVTHELSDAQAFADRLAVLDRGEPLQIGAPDEIVLRPASRRVAELVGYLGFVPVGDAVTGIHPERVMAGAFTDRGPVLTGQVTSARPAGAGWEADLRIGTHTITCRLADRPPATGGELAVTVHDPPYFGTNGRAVTKASEIGKPTAPEHARRLTDGS